MIQRIIQGFIVSGLGVALILYRRTIYNYTGEFDFASKVLGPGGTILFYVLVGTSAVIVGILIVFGKLAFVGL